MIDRGSLLADLQRQVKSLEDDLRKQALADPALHAEWQQARKAERIAATFETWLDGRVTQAAVAWVLGTVFVRFCEDNRLIELPYLAGAGERLDVAKERQVEYFRKHPERTDRDWIVESFDALSVSKVAAGLFDRQHNPLWTILPSHDAAKSLLVFWRTLDKEGKNVLHDFADPSWDTRFLGDLYQDLSDYARKTYALLQTPEFVEEFILDRTLKPALDEFGLDGIRLIDPTCGSGHFLLGAFHRILGKWEKEAPGADRWDLIRRTLLSVHGVDKNPFAVAIARFRLMLAAMKAGDLSDLASIPDFPVVIATGDSLLHGRGAPNRQTDLFGDIVYYHEWEDVDDYIKDYDILGMGSYHAVVGNPPYIVPDDKQENNNYRESYETCYRGYALSVPFAQRFFALACRAHDATEHAGHVGQITANSFLKREFGKKLIERWFRLHVELTEVIDTSGAYIPGHGTPTVILIGRNRIPSSRRNIRMVRSIQGELGAPIDHAYGPVWRAIVEQCDNPGSESAWVSVDDIPRDELSTHPWTISGDRSHQLVAVLLSSSSRPLSDLIEPAGAGAVTREDEAYVLGSRSRPALSINDSYQQVFVAGESIRDWGAPASVNVLWPYEDGSLETSHDSSIERYLWFARTILRLRVAYDKTQEERGLKWYEYSMFFRDRFRASIKIVSAIVSTHNHFALEAGSRVLKDSTLVLVPKEGVSEEELLSTLGILNSSTACFWLRARCSPKGGSGIGRGIQPEAWMERYVYNAANVDKFPLPSLQSSLFAQRMNAIAQQLNGTESITTCVMATPNRKELDAVRVRHEHAWASMFGLQEELDWEVYGLYGLIDESELRELQVDADQVPELNLGERAFEIVLARKMAAGKVKTQWFTRHGSTPITEIPQHWPEEYQKVVAKRIEVIERRRDIALIERPECKRRWVTMPWEKKEKEALKNWLLDRCEARELWFTVDSNGWEQPEPMTVNRLADRLRTNADVVSVARLYAGRDADLADVLAEIVSDEHVPYVAALRYKESGMRKRAQWERTWELQREEDVIGKRLDIPVPPKYSSADFRKNSYWRSRGKLDVPKERFISYPGAGPELDSSELLGWAGWDHREQAHALMTLIDERGNDGWETEQMTPLVAGLAEVLPWVRQWHDDIDPEFGQSWADAYTGYLETQRLRYGVTDEHLADWRPATTRGRKKT